MPLVILTKEIWFGFVKFRAATDEAKLLKEQLESAKELAIKTKELTDEAFEAAGDLTMDGKKHHAALIRKHRRMKIMNKLLNQ